VRELTDFCVFPDIGEKMVRAVRPRQQERRNDAVTSSKALAEMITSDLSRQTFHG
jgi:hypothetical protein